MVDFLNGDFGLYTNDEEQLMRDFIKDNFCPHDKDPLTYDSEDDNLSAENENYP